MAQPNIKICLSHAPCPFSRQQFLTCLNLLPEVSQLYCYDQSHL
ncbi:hypothetical protein FDUTEX481_07241 [Tolypothrix sp. PCC 7601]|nr:hypothetical protein FDUTEX481_07241 [Tolypothrix sp. PCC 7601]